MEFYCPGSWLALEHISESSVLMICIGYNYSRGKVNTSLMSRGCGNTYLGPVYRTNYTTENGEKIHRDVGRPEVITMYYSIAGVIDHHNHSWQGVLALEKKWLMRNGWFCIFTTMIGIVVTDAWLGVRGHFDKFLKCGKKKPSPYWHIPEVEFAEMLSACILSQNSKVCYDDSVPSIPLLELQPGEDKETSETDNITSPSPSAQGRSNRAQIRSWPLVQQVNPTLLDPQEVWKPWLYRVASIQCHQ